MEYLYILVIMQYLLKSWCIFFFNFHLSTPQLVV